MTPAHGTAQRYWRGCRCIPCRVALSRYRVARRWDQLQGRSRRVAARVAWRLIGHLEREGWTRGQIAQALGHRWPSLKLGAQWVRRQTWEKLQQLRESRE